MMFNQARLGIVPEPFEAVDVHLAAAKGLAMVDVQMPVTTECQRIITMILIGIHQAPTLHFLDRVFLQRLRLHIRYHGHRHLPMPLQNAKYRNFAPSAPVPFPCTPPAKERPECHN